MKNAIAHIDVYADGTPFGSADFNVGYLGAEFLRGLMSAHRVPNFPVHGQGTRIVWEESKQTFVTGEVQPLTGGTLVGTYTIQDIWLMESSGEYVSTLEPNVSASGTWIYHANNTYDVTFTLTGGGQSLSNSASGSYVDYGSHQRQRRARPRGRAWRHADAVQPESHPDRFVGCARHFDVAQSGGNCGEGGRRAPRLHEAAPSRRFRRCGNRSAG